ncbi:MAG: NUDIX domain-containing protein [Acidobacteria bacterium]|nr:NUDIX domain-containing protein [Acidobacteriota bacterium]
MISSARSEQYDPREFPPRAVTVDIAVFAVREVEQEVPEELWSRSPESTEPVGALRRERRGVLEVLTVRRAPEARPHPDQLALPGSFVRDDEDLAQAAQRVLREKTGLELPIDRLTQFGAYGDPGRDPRMRVISIGFMALVPDPDLLMETHDSDDPARQWSPVDELLDVDRSPLAFDHGRILQDADERLRTSIEETDASLDLLPEVFTIVQLRRVFEAVWRTRLNPGNFVRSVARIDGFVEPLSTDRLLTGSQEGEVRLSSEIGSLSFMTLSAPPDPSPSDPGPVTRTRGRPAHRYVRGGVGRLHPPMRRPGTYFSRPPSRPT